MPYLVKVGNTGIDSELDPLQIRFVTGGEAMLPIRLNADSCYLIKGDILGPYYISVPTRKLKGFINPNGSNFSEIILEKDEIPPDFISPLSLMSISAGTLISFNISEPSAVNYCFSNESDSLNCLMSGDFFAASSQFDIRSPNKDGTYQLNVKIQDLAGNSTTTSSIVIVDNIRPEISPDFTGFASPYFYKGKSRYFLPKNYNLGFKSSREPIKELDIFYCIVPDPQVNAQESIEDCSFKNSKVFQVDEFKRLVGGMWRIAYNARDKSGNIAFEKWQTERFFIQQECLGVDFIEANNNGNESLANCTDIIDNLIIPPSYSKLSFFDSIFKINGSLVISENKNITNVDGFSNLHQIGSLELNRNPSLVSIAGFSSIDNISQSVKIKENTNLLSLTPLKKCIKIAGTLDIVDNDSLQNLEGLNKLESIGEALYLQGSPLIKNLRELNKLVSVPEIQIIYMDGLDGLDGLENVRHADKLILQSNIKLLSLAGLKGIKNLSFLMIMSNPSLSNLAGLENLKSISNNLTISANKKLENLKGLENLQSIQGTDLSIADNTSLITTEGLCPSSIAVNVLISGNDNLADLKALSCVTTIQGNLEIEDLQAQNLDDLSKLETISGGLTIAELHKLTSIGSHLKLTSVGGDLEVSTVPLLMNFAGLEQLSIVSGSMLIDSNDNLSSLSNLSSLRTVSRTLTVQNNKQLAVAGDFFSSVKPSTLIIKNNLDSSPTQPALSKP